MAFDGHLGERDLPVRQIEAKSVLSLGEALYRPKRVVVCRETLEIAGVRFGRTIDNGGMRLDRSCLLFLLATLCVCSIPAQ